MTRGRAGAYKVRRVGAGSRRNSYSYSITLPVEIGEPMFTSGISFYPELTEEGILLRPITRRRSATLPDWATNEESGTSEAH